MFSIVTLSLRSVSATTKPTTNGHCSFTEAQSVAQRESAPLQHKVTEVLIHGLLRGLDTPLPDHITFPSRTEILPSRVLLYYFDELQVRAVVKNKLVKDEFFIDGNYRRIVAEFAITGETELRAFVKAAGVVKNADKLRIQDLAAALLLGDYRKAAAERTKSQALHSRLEGKMKKLKEEEGKFKFLELKLADANVKVQVLTARVKKQGRDSMGQAGTEGYKHRYPTRFSLTSSVVSQEEA